MIRRTATKPVPSKRSAATLQRQTYRERQTKIREESLVDTLMDSPVGRYEVMTVNSTYVIDLDRMTVLRTPRTGNVEAALLRRDAELITLLAIVECRVGAPMELRLNLGVAGIPFTIRRTTPVVATTRVPSPGERGRW